MGELFLARVNRAGGFEKTCVIKTILPHLADQPDFIRQFLDEARIAAGLVHGTIVPIFDMGLENGQYYFAMEYIAGRDLRSIIRRMKKLDKTISTDLATYIVSEVCKGLDYAHNKRDNTGEPLHIVHRDISPSNILISTTGEVKLIDFGIVRAANRLGETVSGRIQGKFCYMSPEQAKGRSSIDARSDLFSLAIVYDELLTRRKLFKNEDDPNDLASLDRVRACKVSPASSVRPDLPQEIDTVLLRALSKNRDDRFPTASALLVELSTIATGPNSTLSAQLVTFLTELFPEGIENPDWKAARITVSPTIAVENNDKRKISLDEALISLPKLLQSDSGVESVVTPREPSEIYSTTVTAHVSTDSDYSQAAPEGYSSTKPTHTSTANIPLHSSVSKEVPALPIPKPNTDHTPTSNYHLRYAFGFFALIAAIAISWSFFKRDTTGSIVIVESSPPGASIAIDQITIPGNTTPHEFRTKEGPHVVELRLDGYRTFRMHINATHDNPVHITSNQAVLIPLEIGKPRIFTLDIIPHDAVVTLDNVPFTGSTFNIFPDQKVFIRANHHDCDTYQDQIAYDHPEQHIKLTLRCSPPLPTTPSIDTIVAQPPLPIPAVNNPPATPPKPTQKKTTKKRLSRYILLKSDPPSTVLKDGKALGPTPYKLPRPTLPQKIAFQSPGYQSLAITIGPNTSNSQHVVLKQSRFGCLKARAIWPNIADIFIDGKKVSEGKSFYQGTIPFGKHNVTFVNNTLNSKKTYIVEINHPKDCAIISWNARK